MAWPSLDSTDSIVKFTGEMLEVANLGFEKRLPRRCVLVARHGQNAAVAVDTPNRERDAMLPDTMWFCRKLFGKLV
jgi:hypothetical protein